LIAAQHQLELGRRTCIMGVVNVTPDSFSDGGQFFDHGVAAAHGIRLAEQGADIIDIGGESTRPFSEAVSAAEEIGRVVPVIEEIAAHVDIPISIDTTKAEVAESAIKAGATIINDVSALRFDPELAAVAVEFDAPLILMHMLGDPGTMQTEPHYDDVVADIKSFLADAVARAISLGVPRDRLVVDPGIGFGKTIGHNLSLIKHLSRFADLKLPVLIGTSRKAFIRRTLAEEPGHELSPQSPEVATGTQATVAAAILNGAHIVRVHDVSPTVATVKLIDAILAAQ
jgi:dihydropteroate synthase